MASCCSFGILCFIVFLTEGAILDWSAVFLTSARGADPNHAGFGYAAFATTMTIGRLSGDAIVRRVSRTTIILVGGLLAASGLLVATLVPSGMAAMIGFALVGAGLLQHRSGALQRHRQADADAGKRRRAGGDDARLRRHPDGAGGPSAFIAHVASLPTAFLIISVFLIGVAASGRFLKA